MFNNSLNYFGILLFNVLVNIIIEKNTLKI